MPNAECRMLNAETGGVIFFGISVFDIRH